jgi:hypothetical protein
MLGRSISILRPGDDNPLVWYEGSTTTDKRWLQADERGSVVAITVHLTKAAPAPRFRSTSPTNEALVALCIASGDAPYT